MSLGQPLISIFTSEEQELLQKMERQRILLRRKPLLWIVATVILVIGLSITTILIEVEVKYRDKAWPFVVMLLLALFFFGCVAWLTFRFPERDVLSRNYKKLILRRLAPKALSGWAFASSHRLMNEDIKQSGLFKDKANRIAREDYLFGPAGKVVSEVYQIALQAETVLASEGKSGFLIQRETPTNYFYGYFYRVHCPVIFPCSVWVFPKKRKVAGEVDDWVELTEDKYAHNQNRIKFESGDPAFDEKFVVYTDDFSLTLVTAVMNAQRREGLLQFERMFSTACAVSFTTNKVYVMIGCDNDPLDISLHEKIDETLLQKHFEELARMKDVATLVTCL
jgi:Protein of unknown function (DUF3137)